MKIEQINFDDDSFVIHIGQNAKENDTLFQMANQNDIWFHLHNGSSAHVWLSQIKENKVNKQVLHTCAKYVIENSKCSSHNVKICYLRKRFLKKDFTKEGCVILKKTPLIINM